ncbi:MAG TPA: hypothetical protein VHN99_10550 [Deinococcales bacterium]|nr:hypothetical protein [Deinococcales bacterium]
MDDPAYTFEAIEASALLKPCPQCGGRAFLCTTWDSAFCPRCRAWTEKACSDPDCEYCRTRPETPPLAVVHEALDAELFRDRHGRWPHYGDDRRGLLPDGRVDA